MTTQEKKAREAEAKKVIADSKKTVSDEQLLQQLDSINIDALTIKTAKNRSIWKVSFLKSLNENDKTARRKARKEQFNLSKSLLAEIKKSANKIDTDNVKKSAKDLHTFYKTALNDMNIYSNVSSELNAEKRIILDTAFKFMLQIKFN